MNGLLGISIRISTRYSIGIHILVLLHLNRDHRNTSELIAKSVCTNPSFIRKLLSRLIRAQLLKSQRGSGRYELLKDPTDISLLDIYLAVENDNRPTMMGCGLHQPARQCPVVGRSIHSMLDYAFAKGEQAMLLEMGATTLADVIAEGQRNAVATINRSISEGDLP